MGQHMAATQHKMNLLCAKKVNPVRNQQAVRAQTRGKILLLALGSFIAGIALCALWLKHGPSQVYANKGGETAPAITLSETSLQMLQRLNGAVEVRFYCLLDKSTVSDSVFSFANRVAQLLSAYESAANGKLKVSRVDSQTYGIVNSAVVDGIKEFNSDKGNSCFLGLTVACGGQKEILASLAPEWEGALESDITRAIARVAEAGAVLQPAGAPLAGQNGALDALKLSITNLDSISLEEGTRLLRETALSELAQVTKEMDARRKEVQERLAAGGANPSRAVQEAARDELQRIQVEQTAKLQQIAAKSQQQLQALELYKKISR
jgi:hypothetical protein